MIDDEIEQRALEAYHNDPITSSEDEDDSDQDEF